MGVLLQVTDEGEEPCEKEKVCRVCLRGLGLIFCCMCPAAYHSECHDPPLQTRARWVLGRNQILLFFYDTALKWKCTVKTSKLESSEAPAKRSGFKAGMK